MYVYVYIYIYIYISVIVKFAFLSCRIVLHLLIVQSFVFFSVVVWLSRIISYTVVFSGFHFFNVIIFPIYLIGLHACSIKCFIIELHVAVILEVIFILENRRSQIKRKREDETKIEFHIIFSMKKLLQTFVSHASTTPFNEDPDII